MRKLIFGGILTAAFAGTATAQTFPVSGICEIREATHLAHIPTSHIPKIRWFRGAALVERSGQSFEGKVIGMRELNSGWRFSVTYEDDILGPSEVSIFAIPIDNQTLFRIGSVYFDQLKSGKKVIKSMTGFVDAKCSVLFQ